MGGYIKTWTHMRNVLRTVIMTHYEHQILNLQLFHWKLRLKSSKYRMWEGTIIWELYENVELYRQCSAKEGGTNYEL